MNKEELAILKKEVKKLYHATEAVLDGVLLYEEGTDAIYDFILASLGLAQANIETIKSIIERDKSEKAT